MTNTEKVFWQVRQGYAKEILALVNEYSAKDVAVILEKDIADSEYKLGLEYEMEARADHVTEQIPNV